METPQTTEKTTIENTEINTDGKISIPYTEYKALVQGFQEERKKMEDRMWLDVNLSKLDEVLRNNFENSPKKFSENIIQYLARMVGAVHGAFFVVNHDKNIVEATAGYACTLDTMERTTFQIGEGLVGQSAKSQEMLCLDEIETEINSSLGKIKANYMTILPLAYNKTVSGVVELTTLDKLMPRFLIFLDRASRNISAALQSLMNAQKTKEILMDSFEQTEIYKEQQAQIKNLTEQNQKLQTELQTKNLQQQSTEFEPYYIDNDNDQLHPPIISQKNAVPNIIQNLEHQAQIDELLAKIKELEKSPPTPKGGENSTSSENNAELLEKIKVLEEENTENTKKMAILEDSINKKNNDVSIAKEALKWKNDVLEQQDEEISNLKNALAKTQNQEQYTSHEKDATQKYIQELQVNVTFWQNMVAEVSDKIAILQKENETQHQAQNELSQKTTEEKETTQKYIHELQINVTYWQNTVAEITEKLEALQKENETQTQLQSQQSQQTEDEKDAMQRYLNELQINLNFWQEKALLVPENWQEENQKAKENNEKLTQEYEELQKINEWQAEKLQNAINELTQKQLALDQFAKENSEKITKENLQIAQENELLKLDIQDALEKNQELSKEFLNAEQKYKDLISQFEITNQKLRKKEDELLVSQYLLQQNQTPKQETNLQELQDLKEELEAQKEKNRELEENYQKIQNKKQENAEISKEILKLQTENQNYQQKINTLESQLLNININLNENLNQQQNTLDNPKEIAEIAELLLEINQLKEKHQKDILSIQSLENQIADIEEKNAYHWQEKQNNFNEKIADLEIIQDDLVRKKEFLEQRSTMLNQREKELVELFDKINSIFAVLEISPEGEVLSANQKFLQLTRLQATELIGQTYTDFLDKNYAESKEFKVLWESLKVGIAQNVEELAFISTKGEKFFYHTSFIPVMNQENQVTEIVHLFNHLVPPPYAPTPAATITSMAEDRVKALESSLVVIEVDMEGLISRINQQAIWALGYKEGEILACPFTDLLDISEKESDEYQEWQAQTQQGISTAKVVKYVGKEGEKLKFRTFFYPLRDENKQTRQWLVCLQKI